MSQGLRITRLTKRYPGGKLANDGIDLAVERGEVFGLLGPNGAGKTTLVKQIVGLLAPTSGEIRLGGVDLVAHPARARELCAYLPQSTLPIDSLRLREAIELIGRIRGGDRTAVSARAGELIRDLELGEWERTMGHRLSGGIRRLAGFLMACVWPSALLILDEPTNDVDPLRRRLLWREIRALGERGTTILLVTHNVLEAEQSVDRLAIIDEGVIRAAGTCSALKAKTRGQLRLELHLVPGGEAPPVPERFGEVTRLGSRVHLTIARADVGEALDWAESRVRAGEMEEFALGPATLEDVYVELIGRAESLGEASAATVYDGSEA